MAVGRPRAFDAETALAAALQVFWRKGYEGASLPDLTEAMGINRPSLYAAFGNKEELFRKALDSYTAQNSVRLREELNAPTAREAVERLLRGAIDKSSCPNSPGGCLLVQGALASGDEDANRIRDELCKRRSQSDGLLRERFERAIKEGDLPKNTNAAALGAYVNTLLLGIAVRTSNGTCGELKEIVEIALSAFPPKA